MPHGQHDRSYDIKQSLRAYENFVMPAKLCGSFAHPCKAFWMNINIRGALHGFRIDYLNKKILDPN